MHTSRNRTTFISIVIGDRINIFNGNQLFFDVENVIPS